MEQLVAAGLNDIAISFIKDLLQAPIKQGDTASAMRARKIGLSVLHLYPFLILPSLIYL